MKILSINVGLPREVLSGKDIVTTGIFKEPVEGPVKLRKLNLDGDKQADLTVHGGEDKAVYAYPKEHYEYWQHELPNMALPWGIFGENFTTERLIEDVINIGDSFRIGSAEVVATQPRLPCYKLGLKFGRMDIDLYAWLEAHSGISHPYVGTPTSTLVANTSFCSFR